MSLDNERLEIGQIRADWESYANGDPELPNIQIIEPVMDIVITELEKIDLTQANQQNVTNLRKSVEDLESATMIKQHLDQQSLGERLNIVVNRITGNNQDQIQIRNARIYNGLSEVVRCVDTLMNPRGLMGRRM